MPDKKSQTSKQILLGRSAQVVIERSQTTRIRTDKVTAYPLRFTRRIFRKWPCCAYEDQYGHYGLADAAAGDSGACRMARLPLTKTKSRLKRTLSEYFKKTRRSIWLLLSAYVSSRTVWSVQGHQSDRFVERGNRCNCQPHRSRSNDWLRSTGLRRLRRKLITTLSIKDGSTAMRSIR